MQQDFFLVFISQQDLYFFPENQRFKNIMIYYARHWKQEHFHNTEVH